MTPAQTRTDTAASRAVLLTLSLLFAACGAGGAPPDTTAPKVERPVPTRSPAVDAAVAEAIHATSQALGAADRDVVGWRNLPDDADWDEILAPGKKPAGSGSRGTTAHGKLLGGVELPVEGPHHSVIDRLRKFGTRWGTEELVDLVQTAAAYVHRAEGGAPLRVGELSRKGGGDLRWHRSHNSGRDVDLAFYMLDAETGESVPAPQQIPFDGRGNARGREDLRFDTVRNWRLVEGMLTQEAVTVQWLFVSRPIKELLLEHARTSGADPELVRRAEAVMHQPAGASAHANHFHVRIGCSREDRVEGCADDGPQWEWADWHRDALLARALAVARAFRQDEAGPKLRALEFLRKTQSPFLADVAAVWGLHDRDPAVRDASIRTVLAERSWSANVSTQVAKLLDSPGLKGRQRAQLEAALESRRG